MAARRPLAERAELVRRVRAARAYAGLTQDQLAQRIDSSESTMKRREWKGDYHLPELNMIAEVCEVPREFLHHGWDAAVWSTPPAAGPSDGGDDLPPPTPRSG